MSWRVKVAHSEFENAYEVLLYFKKKKHKLSDTFTYECEDTKVEAWQKALRAGTELERSIIEAIIEDDN